MSTSSLAAGLFAAASSLASPHVPPEKAEQAAVERREYLTRFTAQMAIVAHENTCTGVFADDATCKRKWPGPPEEEASLKLTLGWFESRLDARIQGGGCEIFGPKANQRECDGALYPLGAVPKWERGIRKDSKWGTVVFHASTVFQIQGLTDARIKETVGLTDVHLRESAREAGKVMAAHRSRCYSADWVTCTITGYAGTIAYKQAPLRAAMFRKVLARVRSEIRGVAQS